MRTPQLALLLRHARSSHVLASSSSCSSSSSSSSSSRAAVAAALITSPVAPAAASTAAAAAVAAARWHWQACCSIVPTLRGFSSTAGGLDDAGGALGGSKRVRQLADDILALSVLEASQLSAILRKELGVGKPTYGAMPMMPMMAAGAPVASGSPAAAAEEKKEKNEFDVRLEAFSAEGKIKVIKEIRAITNLGLKEAKELVEKAPVVVKAGLSKADAEALQKQLEAAGGKVALV